MRHYPHGYYARKSAELPDNIMPFFEYSCLKSSTAQKLQSIGVQRLHPILSTKNIWVITRRIVCSPPQRLAEASTGVDAVPAMGAILPVWPALAARVQVE